MANIKGSGAFTVQEVAIGLQQVKEAANDRSPSHRDLDHLLRARSCSPD